MRTAESVLFTCCPPAPEARYVSMRRSLVVDLDVDVVLDQRAHLDQREARVAPVGGVERRQAHEPVDALLGREEAVGVLAAREEGRRLEARLLPR